MVVGYFFFHLLYYFLMLGRETEAMVLDRSRWRKLLGLHVWYMIDCSGREFNGGCTLTELYRSTSRYITRPMFALIGYGWNIVVPLAPFAFDTDFQARKLENACDIHRIASR